MKLHTDKNLKQTNLVILGLFSDDKKLLKDYSKDLAQELQEAIKKRRFSTKFGKMYYTKQKNEIIVFGLGKKKEFSLDHLRKIIAKSLKFAKGLKATSFSTNLARISTHLDKKLLGRAVSEALFLTEYKFDKYLTPDKEEPKFKVENVYLQFDKNKTFEKGLKEGEVIATNTNFARDLINEPPMVATPTYIEKEVQKQLKGTKVKLRTLNTPELKKLGMNAFLGVAVGSAQPPKLLILEYNGGKGKPIVLVGKGITFDTGGYNLKPTGYMETMKCDMSGAAAVVATIKAAAELNIKKNIIGITPLCENMVSGKAYKPSDILKAYNKKTIEVGNTDAEGRLALADALAYAEDKFKPQLIIDLATLTGACVVALGDKRSGLLTKDDKLAKGLIKSANESSDLLWRLPLTQEYMESMKGTISDLKNTSPKSYGAGATTAAVFLSHFVEKTKWAHIDIAGTAFISEEKEYLNKGGTGAGVRLLLYYLL